MDASINILSHPSPLIWDSPQGIQTETGQTITTETGEAIQPDLNG